jgi:hypothetical protein
LEGLKMKSKKNLSRRRFLQTTKLAFLAATMGGLAKACTQKSSAPNIVFILADDFGYGDSSCYGATKVSTPNVDRIAQEGVRFTNAYSPALV